MKDEPLALNLNCTCPFRWSLRSSFQNTAKLWRLLSNLTWWIWSLFEQVWGCAWPCLCRLYTSLISHRSIMCVVKVIDLCNPSLHALLICWAAWSTWHKSPGAFPCQEGKEAEKDLIVNASLLWLVSSLPTSSFFLHLLFNTIIFLIQYLYFCMTLPKTNKKQQQFFF